MCLFPTTLSPIFSFGRNMAYDRKLAFCRDQAFGRNLTFGHILAFGSNLTFGRILAFGSLAFGRIVAFGRNSTFGRNSNTSLVGLLALFTCRLIGLIGFVIAAKTISRRLKQAAALGGAMLQSSATEIVDIAFYYFFTASSLHVHLFVREKMMCWCLALARKNMWLWIASFSESYYGDVFQLAEQIFSLSLPKMTKYCVMRECENIHSWISQVGDLASSRQGGIYGFKFPKRFFGDLFQRSHSFLNSFLDPNLKT